MVGSVAKLDRPHDPPQDQLVRLRRLVISAGLFALVAKLLVATATTGTDDVLFWTNFARAVQRVGPIAVYGEHFPVRYSHPPPVGWLLMALNGLTELALPFRFLIRVPATLADFGSTILVFEVLRTRRPARVAAGVAMLVALNPVLFVISGFHGNTDSVFVFFLLLSVYLLVDRHTPALAGPAFAASVGIKLVPLVALPVVLATMRRRADLARFGATLGVALAASWTPALVRQWKPIRTNVLGYAGQPSNWGVGYLLRKLGDPLGLAAFLTGPGRFLLLTMSAVPAALWAWRRPERAYAAVGLTLVSLLALVPSWATQYLAWPIVFGYLLDARWATVSSLVSGASLWWTYTVWSGGFPWNWAHPRPPNRLIIAVDLLAWLVLFTWTAFGWRTVAAEAARRTESATGQPAERRHTGPTS